MKYKIGIAYSNTDPIGRLVSAVCIQEDTKDDLGFGNVLCSCTYVGLELDDAISITKNYFIKSLNKKNDRVSKKSTT